MLSLTLAMAADHLAEGVRVCCVDPGTVDPLGPPAPRGRSVQVHPDERLLAELRARQLTPAGRAKLRERVDVEHTLARIGRWQGCRAATWDPQEPQRLRPRPQHGGELPVGLFAAGGDTPARRE